ncbi:glyoxal oxidase [Ceratobasidium sp. AG-Ba]|nr:glyoxal oxidase [Ceratobasidium sp. AG-Ba]
MGKNKTPGKAAAKAAKKAKANEKQTKRETKNAKKSKIAPEDDLEAILDEMRQEWEKAHKVTEETDTGPPSRRANSTLTPCPNGNHLWCIGGEYFSEDGKAHFYNDVYRYAPDKDEWRLYTSPTSPSPRSAHSVVGTPANGGQLFLFGGEFSSLNQTTFHHASHYKSWERIETKTSPSARSGHRMAMWKHYILLFGGFNDPGIKTKYFDDLWIFDTQLYNWKQVEFGPTARRPSSGFSFLPTADGVVLHGGYVKEYVKGKRVEGKR